MSDIANSLFLIAHGANDAFVKLYPESVTSVGFGVEPVVCIDCHFSGVRILLLENPKDSMVNLVVGRKDTGEIAHIQETELARLSFLDVLRLMEERFLKQPKQAL